MVALIKELLDELEEIRKEFPGFGYSGRSGWVESEDKEALDEWDVGE